MEGAQVPWECIKCYLFHGLFQHVLYGMHIALTRLHALCISQKDNICVAAVHAHTERCTTSRAMFTDVYTNLC